MQQDLLHCLQQKHRLIIQLLLLIVLILSCENATRVYRSCHCAFLPRLFLFGGTKFSLSDKDLFFLNLNFLPSMTPSWIATLSLCMLKH